MKISHGSSETIRKTTFDFSLFLRNLPQHKKQIDQNFLEWFIGFSEGDGSFIVSHTSGKKNDESKDPQRLFFILTQKDVQILHFIRSFLGFGRVSSHGQYFRYIVADIENIDRLILLFNGNLLLEKTNTRFEYWLQARNLLHARQSRSLIQLFPSFRQDKWRKEVLKESAWLSGFIDAEGCFNFYKRELADKNQFQVVCRFMLVQKGEYSFFQDLQEIFQTGKIYLEKNRINIYRYWILTQEGLTILMKYLEKHKLRSKKKIQCGRMYRMMYYIAHRDILPWQGKVLRRVLNLCGKEKTKVDDRVH